MTLHQQENQSAFDDDALNVASLTSDDGRYQVQVVAMAFNMYSSTREALSRLDLSLR